MGRECVRGPRSMNEGRTTAGSRGVVRSNGKAERREVVRVQTGGRQGKSRPGKHGHDGSQQAAKRIRPLAAGAVARAIPPSFHFAIHAGPRDEAAAIRSHVQFPAAR
jgi:hypothetical protein